MAVGVGDMLQVTIDTKGATPDKWHMTCDIYNYTFIYIIFALDFFSNIFWFQCFYLHISRDSVATAGGIVVVVLRTGFYVSRGPSR